MQSQTFEFSSTLAAPAQEVFAWHERPGAFELLSPPWIKVKVTERVGGIADGGVVCLELNFGPARLQWNLEHRNYVPGKQFQDVQVTGPFLSWKHTHIFADCAGSSCLMTDKIEYRPFPLIGSGLSKQLLIEELKRMFTYRHEVLSQQMQQKWPIVKPLTVGVSGSHGLVGSALMPMLTSQNHNVVRLVRRTSAQAADGVVWNDSKNTSGLENLDAIVHLAGENIASGRWDAKRKKAIRESRVGPTRQLCETIATLKNPPKVLLCASAIGYYGSRGDQDLDETAGAGRGFLAELCQDWEQATAPAIAAGVRVVNLRLGVVLTPAGGALAKMLPPFLLGAGGPIGSGKQYMSWIALDDIAGAIYHCLINGELAGPVNLVSPEPVSNNEFTKALGSVLQRPTIFPVPGFAAKLILGEMADELLLSSARVYPAKLLSTGYRFMYPSISQALHHLLGR